MKKPAKSTCVNCRPNGFMMISSFLVLLTSNNQDLRGPLRPGVLHRGLPLSFPCMPLYDVIVCGVALAPWTVPTSPGEPRRRRGMGASVRTADSDVVQVHEVAGRRAVVLALDLDLAD